VAHEDALKGVGDQPQVTYLPPALINRQRRWTYFFLNRAMVKAPRREHVMPRVLVIDDQGDVRAMISMVLRINHFEVVEAANAAAGLKAFEDAAIDLAIVDIFLLGSNGFDVIASMRECVPGLPIVAISGMTALDIVADMPGLADVVCLQKPFRPNELMAAIEAARPASPVSRGLGPGTGTFDGRLARNGALGKCRLR
jgi:CheY-like chemotaxis protein